MQLSKKSGFVFACLTLASVVSAQPTYSVTPLPVTDVNGEEISYTAIDNNGDVAGVNADGSVIVVDTLGAMHVVATTSLSFFFDSVLGLNDSWLGAGFYAIQTSPGGKLTKPTYQYTPCTFNQNGNAGFLGLPFLSSQDGTLSGQVSAVNDAGVMVGYADGYDAFSNPIEHATRWSGGAATDLGTLPGGQQSYALAVNASGLTVGYAIDSSGIWHAASFSGGTVTDLGLLPGGTQSVATAVNSAGTIVGYGTDINGIVQPLLFAGGTPQILPAPPSIRVNSTTGQAFGIADDGTVMETSFGNVKTNDIYIVYQGSAYDLSATLGMDLMPFASNASGQILVQSTGGGIKQKKGQTFPYYVLTPQASNILTVTVTQRIDGGTVPDGTNVKLLNNDGTVLSPPTSTATSGGIATFSNPPTPSGSNTSYEVEVLIPAGGKGVPAVQNNVSLGSTTVYYTAVEGDVVQSLIGAPPVAYATCRIGTVSASTGTNGVTPAIWLPDGTYSGSLGISPGRPCSFNMALGSSSSSNLVAYSGYAGFLAHMTRVYLTARNANGTSFIAHAGSWSISPGGLSALVNGQATSSPWWLPNGTYTASLSGASESGTGTFDVGTLTSSGLRTIIVH